MRYVTCYEYDAITKEYIGATFAFEEPINHQYILPPNCTFVEAPNFAKYEIPVFVDGDWVVKKDYRPKLNNTNTMMVGKPYYNPNDYWWAEEQYMSEIGDIPEGMSFEKMEKPEVVLRCEQTEKSIKDYKEFLKDTDYIHFIMLEQPDRAGEFTELIQERIEKRNLINELEQELEILKASIVSNYTSIALNYVNVG